MKKIIGKSTSTLTKQIEWCQSGVDITEDDDKAFCGGFEYELDANDELVYLRSFVTTKHLIHSPDSYCKRCLIIQIATFFKSFFVK